MSKENIEGHLKDESTDSLFTPAAQAMLDAVEDYLAERSGHKSSIAVDLKDRLTYSSRAV